MEQTQTQTPTAKLHHWLEWQPWSLIALLSLAFILFNFAIEVLANSLGKAGALLSYPATALFLLYALVTIVAVCRVRTGPAGELGLGLVFAAGIALFSPLFLGLKPVHTICVILAAAFLGRLLGRIIREPNLIPVAAVVGAGIDIWGVYWGPVAQVSQKAPAIASAVSAAVPAAAAAAKAGLPVVTAIGLGDFLFLAIFLFALRRFHLNQRAAFWIILIIMLIAPAFYLLGELLPIAENLPGLPFIAAGIIASNWKHFKISPREKRDLLLAGLIIVGVIAAIVIIKRLLV